MRSNRIRAVVLALALTAWSHWVAPRLPARVRVAAQAVLGGWLAHRVGAPLGLRPPALLGGVRVGLAAAATVCAAVAAATAIGPVRRGMAARALPAGAGEWLLLGIPVGTVWSEEAAYRAALGTWCVDAFGPRGGPVAQAVAFGLSHVVDARTAGEPVLGTVAVTGIAGWIFGRLYAHTGSLAAPLLAHLAVNEAGAVAALLVARAAGRAARSRG